MFSPATVATIAPLILGLARASVVRAQSSLFSQLVDALADLHLTPSHQVQEAPSADVSTVPEMSQAAIGVISTADTSYQCNNWNDWDCYRRY